MLMQPQWESDKGLEVEYIDSTDTWHSLIGDLKFFPVIITNEKSRDFVFLRSEEACPRFISYKEQKKMYYDNYSQILHKSGTFRRVQEVFDIEVAKIIDEYLGYDTKNYIWRAENVVKLFSELFAFRYLQGKDYQPSVTKKELSTELMDELQNIHDGLHFYKLSADKENIFPKLQTTGISKMILADMLNIIRGLSVPNDSAFSQNPSFQKAKFQLFSGDSSTIYPFILILGLTSAQCHSKTFPKINPDPQCKSISYYGSNISFELSKLKKEGNDHSFKNEQVLENYAVKILFNGTPVKFCPILIPEYGEFYCKFSLFELYLEENFILQNEKRYCGVKEAVMSDNFYLNIGLCAIVGSFCVFLIVLIFNMLRHLKVLKREVDDKVVCNYEDFKVEGRDTMQEKLR